MKMTNSINKYYFTLFFTTILLIFSITFKESLIQYFLMTAIILFSTFSIEIALNKKYTDIKEKAENGGWLIALINIIVLLAFTFLIF
ncbi:hypothetical protein [Mammaliicoccus vitulinus]|uniref:hypothetical protein n=1 Tax=Mammaliicoccus vitulinus TaxID=71237 RepID=UPI000D1FB8C2|nr:hypothetical protein [Mammaliicoccus vitulinus]PTI71522.1 hypothetical protein BU073_06840 [Mammaliicoccus vitulinus]